MKIIPLVLVGALLAPCSAIACDLTKFQAGAGLAARMDGEALTLTWSADPGQEGRLSFVVENGAPKIRALDLRRGEGTWTTIVRDAEPDFHVTTGLRRMSRQQYKPLLDAKIAVTEAEVAKHRWDPFWDAPLDLSTTPNPNVRNPPPPEGLPGQPGLPRDPNEVAEADAVYAVKTCSARRDGARVEVRFPGVTVGPFQGALMYTVYAGSNLVRQEIVASTDKPWVAYKYDAGLRGLAIEDDSQVVWRDTANRWQTYRFGGAVDTELVPLRAANRLAAARQRGGAIAAFPPPHKFFWAREVSINMGYNWYRQDADGRYAFGVRQNEKEDESENPANWALYSARPGTQQLMPVYFYPTLGDGGDAIAGALTFTRGDVFKAIPGFKVMNHHYHMDLGERWTAEGLRTKFPDLQALKATGFDIVSPIWSLHMVGFDGADPLTVEKAAMEQAQKDRPRGDDFLALGAMVAKGAARHSDKDFLIMPNVEVYGSPLGGHTDLLLSHQVLFDQKKPGQPFTETHPTYGKVYHIGSAAELMAMVRAEDALISMPHPRTKATANFPDRIKDTAAFLDPRYHGFGFRWGMGLDGSERRTCELRCLPLLDDMSNWMADKPGPLKNAISISEARHQSPGDDIYASAPVTYVKLAKPPRSPAEVVEALAKGDSFITTGEVLITAYEVRERGAQSLIVADVEWTFPLDFVEIVWGDGKATSRQVISAKGLPPFGAHRFEIPFDASGKKWIRFAAWDSASEGAFTQPVRLNAGSR